MYWLEDLLNTKRKKIVLYTCVVILVAITALSGIFIPILFHPTGRDGYLSLSDTDDIEGDKEIQTEQEGKPGEKTEEENRLSGDDDLQAENEFDNGSLPQKDKHVGDIDIQNTEHESVLTEGTGETEIIFQPGELTEQVVDNLLLLLGGEILQEDKKIIEEILKKIDIDKVNEITCKGYGEKELSALKEYLSSQLTDSEYQKTKELVSKYLSLFTGE